MLTKSLQRIFAWPREVWGKCPKKMGITRPRTNRGVSSNHVTHCGYVLAAQNEGQNFAFSHERNASAKQYQVLLLTLATGQRPLPEKFNTREVMHGKLGQNEGF